MSNANQEVVNSESQNAKLLYKFHYMSRYEEKFSLSTYHTDDIKIFSMFTEGEGRIIYLTNTIEMMNKYENGNGNVDFNGLIEYLDKVIISWQSM